MLYLFTGNNRYLIKQEAQKWKLAFGEKYGVENTLYIDSLESVSVDHITESILSRSLFSEKRLVIIDGFPFSWEKNFSLWAEVEKNILENLDKIPEETLVVFLSENPDKRKTWYKTLSKIAEVRDFSVSWEDEVFRILASKYSWKIDNAALQKIIFFKGWNLQKSMWEIEKLGITKANISLEDVEATIIPEFEESIFVFIDTLLTKNHTKIFNEFENLLQFSNLYALYHSIIANLRVFLYIEYLKSQKKSVSEIGDIMKLWNRQFLINKKHKSSYSDIQKLYFDLLSFDKNMKFWKFISSDEEDLQKELERVFVRFLA